MFWLGREKRKYEQKEVRVRESPCPLVRGLNFNSQFGLSFVLAFAPSFSYLRAIVWQLKAIAN